MSSTTANPWWHSAVIYQIYPRSFYSTAGNVGTLAGVSDKIPYLRDLGVDAVWLSPFYRSPQRDAGYDVANYMDVDPRFGTLGDAEEMIARAHDAGLRVIVDLVPNHTSDAHAWFQAALAAGPNSAERERYWFRDEKPNDWKSVFGGSAWTRVCDREDAPGSPWQDDTQWYLHLFDTSQPDLNWQNREVWDMFDQVLHFWLQRGVDGFRVDVAHGLVKDPALPDWDGTMQMVEGGDGARPPMFDQEGVHDIYRHWHEILAQYDGDRMLVAEAWVDPPARLARYVRPDEMHQAFNFDYLCTRWDADELATVIAETMDTFHSVGAPCTWVLSNHDVIRHATRLGWGDTGRGPNGIGANDPQPDRALGLRRARAASQLMLALPGSAYLYQGEELGLPEHTTLPNEVREDPAFFRTEGAELGRDGCRIPLPWQADAPGCGFSPSGQTWLPQPAGWAEYAVDRQLEDPTSTLQFYQHLLALRKHLQLGEASVQIATPAAGVLQLQLTNPSGEEVLVIAAIDADYPLPAPWQVEISSAAVAECDGQVIIPANTCVWARRVERA